MAYNGNITDYAKQYISATDVTAELKTFFSRDTGINVVQTGAGEAAVGVLWYAQATTNAAVSVICGGQPDVLVGTGGVSAGDVVASDANGAAVVATTDDIALGVARHDAAAGELVRIEFLGEAQYTVA